MAVRNDWTLAEVKALFALPFMELMFMAHRGAPDFQAPNSVQISTLLSIKTGACPEDCAYCPQSARFDTGLETQELLEIEDVAARARASEGGRRHALLHGRGVSIASTQGSRQGARHDPRGARALGMETCATLGMLTPQQAHELKAAGLDYYNHNLDTSPRYYAKIITTRTFQDRLDTLEAVRSAGMKVCCGGIVGMGEEPEDRAELLHILATLPEHPQSVPINQLVRVPGTPLEHAAALDPFDFVRTVAVARILMPQSCVRLSAGRGEMSDELQALCFLAGANSIFYGEKLLTTGNPDTQHDQSLFRRLKIAVQAAV